MGIFLFSWPVWKTRLGPFQNEFAMEESLERGERDNSLPLWDRLHLEQCFECRTDISTILLPLLISLLNVAGPEIRVGHSQNDPKTNSPMQYPIPKTLVDHWCWAPGVFVRGQVPP